MKRRELLGVGAATLLWPSSSQASQVRWEGMAGRVVVDPRIELMSIVQLLGNYFLLGEAKTSYRADVHAWFDRLQGHPVVELASSLAKDTLSFDAVPDLILRFTEPQALERRKNLLDEVPPGIPDPQQRLQFLALLRDFAKASRFASFFERHRPLYRSVVHQISPAVVPNVNLLEAYTGASLGDWQVIAGLLLHDGGFGPRKVRQDGSVESYAVIGPMHNSIGDPDFRDAERLQDLVVHEFAHSLVNPLAESQSGEVQKYFDRFEPLRATMMKVGSYDTWPTVVDEHVVRAVTARVTARLLGEPAGAKAVAREVGRGFKYVPALVERLARYEADRQRWPTLSSYYADLLKAFA